MNQFRRVLHRLSTGYSGEVPAIPAAADLRNLEFYSIEDFLCANFGCAARCEHELRRDERKRWTDVTLFEFNEASKLGKGGFGHV